MMRPILLMLGLMISAGSTAWAIPQSLNFQGFLKESGSPVTGTRDMTVGIYAAQAGGSPLFTEAHSAANTVIVSTGVFNVMVGSLTTGGIPLSLFDGSDRYVEVTVGPAPGTVLPRQKITSVGNAFFSATAGNLPSGAAIQISSAVLTATGSNQYSLQTSSGINVQGGGVTAPYFSGSFVGDGSGLTGLTGTDSTKVAKAGDTMTGQLTLAGSTLTVIGGAFSVGGATLAVVGGKVGIGTGAPSTKLHLNSGAMTIDGAGAGMNVVGPSSATYFYGDGSGLTGLTGTDNTKVAKAGDAMSGQLTLAGSTLTVTGSAFSVGGSTLSVVGGRVGIGTASPTTKLHVNSGAMTIDGSGAGLNVSGPSTATYFYGNGSGLTGITVDGYTVSQTLSLSSVSSATITGLDLANYSYRVEFRLTISANAGLQLRCNDDGGNGYEFSGFVVNNIGSANFGTRPQNYISISYDSTTRIATGNGAAVQMWITKDQVYSNKAVFTWDATYLNDSSQRERLIGGGIYNGYTGSPAVTKCSFYPYAGSITGSIKVLRLAN